MDRMNLNKMDSSSKIFLDLYSVDGIELFYRDTILINNLVEILDNIRPIISNEKQIEDIQQLEILYSSEVEGYFTTRRDLSKFINKEREPRTKDEKAVYNNYLALQHGLLNKSKLLSSDNNEIRKFILELNSIILDYEITHYRLEPVDIVNRRGDIVHEGLPFEELDFYMNLLIEFTKRRDINPIIGSYILHFYFVYIHPFIDGNGRTARSFSYLYLIAQGHDNYNLFSVSYMLPQRRKQYYDKLKDVKVNKYDLTEFIEFMLKIMLEGISEIEDKYKLINLICNVKDIYRIYDLEYNDLTETLLVFLFTKDNFSKDNFYRKTRSKFIRNGYTDEEFMKCINVNLNTLVSYNIIDNDNKLNKKLIER